MAKIWLILLHLCNSISQRSFITISHLRDTRDKGRISGPIAVFYSEAGPRWST